MLPLVTKQSGGKLLHHSDLRGGGEGGEGSVSRRGITQQKEKEPAIRYVECRSLYWAGSLAAAARELARYKLDLVGVQEVRWDKEGTVKAGNYSFFYQPRRQVQ
jgi:hypothetical protein